jgi:hypothetical protein
MDSGKWHRYFDIKISWRPKFWLLYFSTQASTIQKFLPMFWHPTKCYPKILAHVLANKFGMPMIWPAHVLVGQILATNQSGPYFQGNFS